MQILTTEELINYCKSYQWKRKITQLHIHHTWKPSHKDYNGNNGLQLQEAMRNYHINTNGWSDIGQHLTLLPDGKWVTGRDFNKDPASISGWNTGAFAIEMLGNFDVGNDRFEGKQAEAMYKFCAWFVQFKNLSIDNQVKFHRDHPNAGKTCPGSGINRDLFMKRLKEETKPQHWAQKYYDYLLSQGIVIHETRFDDTITRGEVFALMARILGYKEG